MAGRIIPVIQVRWSDETEWKTLSGYDPCKTAETQLEAFRRNWSVVREEQGLKYDAEFRVLSVHVSGEETARKLN